MKLIFAQGNPGSDYTQTRHNVGWQILDAFARQQGSDFAPRPKFFADIAEASVAGENILLVKPQTFYNETGRSARAIVDFYKLSPADILVLHDELALPFGTIRVREKGSDAGNNGIKSLNAHLGQDYTRLRIGVANDQLGRIGAFDFVLGKFSADERAALENSIIPKAAELIEHFCRDELQLTSHNLDK